jgi:hypothetical protein
MKSKIIIRIVIFLAIVSVLTFLSYFNVRHKAEKIFHPFIESELYYYGTQFMPFTLYYENNNFKKWCGSNWYVSYDFQTKMTSGALSIRYNIFGKVIDTNPGNLLNEIIPNKLKLKEK